MQLGKKIRDLRLRRGLTVQRLAQASNLSKGFISQVENDHTSPSLTTLRDLAAALQTSVAYLVVEEERIPQVVRASERPRVLAGNGAARIEVLSAQPKRNLEMVLAELPPGPAPDDGRHFHHGEECMVVLEGRVRLLHGDEVLTLETGDSCHYDGRVPHVAVNIGAGAARVLIAMTPAAFEPLISVPEPHPATNGTPLESPTRG